MNEFDHKGDATWIQLNGVRVYSRYFASPVNAAAPPVIMIHGIGVSGKYMVPAARLLAEAGFEVYVPDLPGFGRSDKPRPKITVGDLADDLAGYMEAIGVARAALIGNSFGCQVIGEFCLRYPSRATGIVLLGPTVDPQARTFHQQFMRLMIDSVREPPSQIAIVAVDYLRFGLIKYLRTFSHALKDRLENKAPHITVPALVMRGSRDPIAPHRWVEELAALFPAGQMATVEGGPHTANYACPDTFVHEVLPFLISLV